MGISENDRAAEADREKVNLDALKQYKPDLYQLVVRHARKNIGEVFITSSGDVSLVFHAAEDERILAYNTADPWQDAELHLQTVQPIGRSLVLFIGMGLGYGPVLVYRERPEISKMVILEPSLDLFCLALRSLDMSVLIASENVSFFVGEIDFEQFEEDVCRAASLEDTHILRHLPSFQWKNELYHAVNDQAFAIINHLNVQGGTTRSSGLPFLKNRLANYTILRHSSNLDLLIDVFKGKPAVVVAAGPSLDQCLPGLKNASNHCVIIAADSALASLLEAGIMPDFVTSIDFQEANFEKIAPFLSQTWPFALVSMVKGTPLIPKRFSVKHLFLEFPDDRPHWWVMESLGIKSRISFGGSVAHLSLGIAQIIGADPIVFVGQDLSYPGADAVDHAKGTVFSATGFPNDRELFYVPGVHGEKVRTDRQFMSLQKQFEEMVEEHPATYLNATSRGAHIAGTMVMGLDQVIEKYMRDEFLVEDIVDKAVSSGDSWPIISFIKTCDFFLKKIKKMKGLITEAARLKKIAVKELEKYLEQNTGLRNREDLSPHLAKSLTGFDRVNSKLDKSELWEHLLEVTFQALDENDRMLEQNKIVLREKGYGQWLSAELERIEKINIERDAALKMYWEELNFLVHFLKAENKLLSLLSKRYGEVKSLELVRLYVSAGNLLQAKNILEKMISPVRKKGEYYFFKGACAAGLLDWQKAEEYWLKAISFDQFQADSVAAIRKENAALWITIAAKKWEMYPSLFVTWLQRVAFLISAEMEWPASLKQLWKEHAVLITESLEKRKTALPAKLLSSWNVFKGREAEINFFQARLDALNGDYPAAINNIKEALRKKPDSAEWLTWLARFYLESERYDEGVDVLQRAVTIDPRSGMLWHELGDILLNNGDYNGAVLAYERCFVALPDHLESLLKMGDAYLRDRQLEAAVAAYQSVLAKMPDNQDALLRLELVRGGQ